MIIAITSKEKSLCKLSEFYQQRSFSTFFVRDRIFISQKIGSTALTRTQIVKDAFAFEVFNLHIGFSGTAPLALLQALHGALPLAECPVSSLFKFISPFCEDEVDDLLESEIIAWFNDFEIETFQDFRDQIKRGLPRSLVFLGERFSEMDVCNSSKYTSVSVENFVNGVEKRIGAQSVYSGISTPSMRSSFEPVPRPSRLLPVPSPLAHFANRLVGAGKQWTCEEWSKPERIAASSQNRVVERDYFRVKTKEGDELWIFRDIFNGQLYWHGLFD